jgi:low affinity Fe/Cu permease
MRKRLNQLLTNVGISLSRPWAVAAVGVYTLLWLIFDRESLNWHGIATLVTLWIALFIQRSEHRDTQAIHAKLDELLRANGEAKEELAKLDEKEPEQIEAFREQQQ